MDGTTQTPAEAYNGTLNAPQTEVLRWIAAGCPDDVMHGPSHRVSALALKTRGLVTVSGRGTSWAAEVTPRGQEYLERLAEEERVAEELVSKVAADSGVLRVPLRLEPRDVDYEGLVAQAHRLGKVPAGRKLTISHDYGRREYVIRLAEAAGTASIQPKPVPVPDRLVRPHHVAKQFRQQTDKHRVSRAELARATRIVHAIATQAETRGYGVSYDGDLTITIHGQGYRLRISEEKVSLRGEWDAETRRRADVPYPQYLSPRKMRNYDSQATGRLTIVIDHGYGGSGRTNSFSDRTRWTLEQKLPDLFVELERRAAEDDVAHREAERRAQERHEQWEGEIELAKERWLEARRGSALREQTQAWHDSQMIRDYIAALAREQGASERSAEWVAWARAYADRVDPLQRSQQLPEMAPQIAPDDLKPFLPRGVSPYGPAR